VQTEITTNLEFYTQEKTFFTSKGEIKTFPNRQNLREFTASRPVPRKYYQELLRKKMMPDRNANAERNFKKFKYEDELNETLTVHKKYNVVWYKNYMYN